MPELPEVEVVRAGLEPAVDRRDASIASRCSMRARCAGTTARPRTSSHRLTGATFAAPERRGKFLWLPIAGDRCEPASALVVHLGMSGQVLLRDPRRSRATG